MTHTTRTAWLLRIAATVMVGEQAAWFILHPINVLGSVLLGLVVLLAWQLLVGSRVAWVIAAFLAVSQLAASFTLSETVWLAVPAAAVLACLLVPSSRAFVWAEKQQRSRSLDLLRSGPQRMYGKLPTLIYSWVPRVAGSVRGKFILVLVVCVLVVRPLVGVLYDFHRGSGHGSVLVDVLWRVVWVCYSVAEFAAIALVAMAAYRYLRRRNGDDKSAAVGPGSGERRGDAPDTGPAGQLTEVRDPRAYPDQDRPAGWYVDPSDPVKMHYWGGGSPGWVGTARTPRNIRSAWQ